MGDDVEVYLNQFAPAPRPASRALSSFISHFTSMGSPIIGAQEAVAVRPAFASNN
jgi:hypothetical protein